jgi:hypothetical protein
MGRTMTNAHTVGHQFFQNHGTDSFSVFVSSGCERVSGSFIIGDTRDHFETVYTIHTNYSSAKCCSQILLNICKLEKAVFFFSQILMSFQVSHTADSIIKQLLILGQN